MNEQNGSRSTDRAEIEAHDRRPPPAGIAKIRKLVSLI